MKIVNLRVEEAGNTARLAVTVEWEDNDKPKMDIYFGTDLEHGQDLTETIEPFLVCCLLPAMYHGEKRLYLDGGVCPELMDGIVDAIGWLRYWFYPDRVIPAIEAQSIVEHSADSQDATGFFLSGGIDSLAALRHNMLLYPRQHAGAFKHGMMLYGQNIESNTQFSVFKEAFDALKEVAEEAEMELMPVYTNVRELEEATGFFLKSNGLILAAAGHAFTKKFNVVSIAATENIPALMAMQKGFLKPLGSHPLVDMCCGSRRLRIRHDGMSQSRLDKARLVAEWDLGLQNVRVCTPNWPGNNCGECEKCVRTMLGFLALGVLEKTKAFPYNDLSAEIVKKAKIKSPLVKGSFSNEYFYLELVPLLEKRGRKDLVDAIHEIVAIGHDKYYKKSLIDSIEAFDKEQFGGKLRKIKKAIIG